MIRVAALADIHANIHALNAVLSDPRSEDVDLFAVLGDVIAGPFPAETFDRLAALEGRAKSLRGNADRLVLEDETDVSRWRRERLGHSRLAAVRAWPLTFTVDVDGLGRIRCCHATPTSDEGFITRITPPGIVASALAGTSEHVVVGGHTHVQFDRRVDGYRFVNVGSVGWPFEGRRGAFWALLGPDVELIRTEYDVEEAAAAIRASGHPGSDRVGELLRPPSPEPMSRMYEALREG